MFLAGACISASASVSQETLNKLGAWDFSMLVKYDERYISGFRSETYQVSPQDGLERSKASLAPVIQRTIMQDIGGDEQRIDNSETELQEVMIKYVLLPIWISSYVYKNKSYQFAINGYTICVRKIKKSEGMCDSPLERGGGVCPLRHAFPLLHGDEHTPTTTQFDAPLSRGE